MINIAIDGHAGSGKSVIAEELAKKLNFKILNTGAIYRGLACAYRDMKLGQPNEEKIDILLKNVKLDIKFEDKNQLVFVNGINYTPQLREEEISMLSSTISTYPKLRTAMLDIQRNFAKNNNCIMEGRDIGTIVLPNADIKLFITASAEERARRRLLQNKSGIYEEVLKHIIERDYQDEHRQIAPLKMAKDAILIDTGGQTVEESVEKCLNIIKNKVNFSTTG